MTLCNRFFHSSKHVSFLKKPIASHPSQPFFQPLHSPSKKRPQGSRLFLTPFLFTNQKTSFFQMEQEHAARWIPSLSSCPKKVTYLIEQTYDQHPFFSLKLNPAKHSQFVYFYFYINHLLIRPTVSKQRLINCIQGRIFKPSGRLILIGYQGLIISMKKTELHFKKKQLYRKKFKRLLKLYCSKRPHPIFSFILLQQSSKRKQTPMKIQFSRKQFVRIMKKKKNATI